jgi:hypothetical protein
MSNVSATPGRDREPWLKSRLTGAGVGPAVGRGVGAAVGRAVGRGVGAPVGRGVGAVGVAVGGEVGVAVGAAVGGDDEAVELGPAGAVAVGLGTIDPCWLANRALPPGVGGTEPPQLARTREVTSAGTIPART